MREESPNLWMEEKGVLCRAAHSPDCQLPFDLQPTKGGCECAEQADSNRIDTCWLVL